jgi:hypothetical protein
LAIPAARARFKYVSIGAAVFHGPVNPSPCPA